MAVSPAHRLGQMIGDLIEDVMASLLAGFCGERGLYLDKKGERKPARKGRKISWEDRYGNSHDLDFVIEKNGSEEKRGHPLAFIEVAWRRYTKHSRNKAQEIQGAILPIAEKYPHDKPFLGGVLAGVFTDGSLNQMRSAGFKLVLFPYDTIIAAFRSVGIDADFDEDTEDGKCGSIIDAILALSPRKKDIVKKHLADANAKRLGEFFRELETSLGRHAVKIAILPLYGKPDEFTNMRDAKQFILGYHPRSVEMHFRKFEIFVEFNNGDTINASFTGKNEAVGFLEYVDSN